MVQMTLKCCFCILSEKKSVPVLGCKTSALRYFAKKSDLPSGKPLDYSQKPGIEIPNISRYVTVQIQKNLRINTLDLFLITCF